MARKFGPTIEQEELYPLADEPMRDDSRPLDLDAEEESPFLRGQKRVSVRRGTIPKKTATRLIWAALACVLLLIAAIGVGSLYRYGQHSWRFRVESSDDIEIAGLHNVTRAQVMEVMGGDIGRNIFFVPLAQRKEQLEQIPWVESASVMRFVPNRLRVEIHERTPVAFARVGSKILLVDASGALMELPGPGKGKFSFPVILGTNAGEPPSTRAARMKIYQQLMGELDSEGGRYSQEISEVDLSDPDDVKVLAESRQGEVLLHLGSSNYLDRYKVYVAHVQEWRQQFDKLESVDLRYERQIIVNPDLRGAPRQAPLSPWAAKVAMAAGVKPAALITRELVTKSSAPVPVTIPHAAKVGPKAMPKPGIVRKAARNLHHKTATRRPRPQARVNPAAVHPSPPAAAASKPVQKPTNPAPTKTAASKKPSPAIAKGQEQR